MCFWAECEISNAIFLQIKLCNEIWFILRQKKTLGRFSKPKKIKHMKMDIRKKWEFLTSSILFHRDWTKEIHLFSFSFFFLHLVFLSMCVHVNITNVIRNICNSNLFAPGKVCIIHLMYHLNKSFQRTNPNRQRQWQQSTTKKNKLGRILTNQKWMNEWINEHTEKLQ